MSFLRFFMLLSLVVWIGGIIFFAVTAPVVFGVLPTHDLAGQVVNRLLPKLHWMGLISGIVFLICSMSYVAWTHGTAQPFAPRHLGVILMIILTLVSMYVITPKMAALRTSMGVIDNIPQSDARRVEFNRLHEWSTRTEVTVLAIGLVVLFLTARRLT